MHEGIQQTGARPHSRYHPRGRSYSQCETLDTARYLDALEQKLLEEAAEYRQTPCMEEMADLMEVIEAICKGRGFDPAALQAVKQEKAAKRGAFEKRIFLHAVAEPDELLDR